VSPCVPLLVNGGPPLSYGGPPMVVLFSCLPPGLLPPSTSVCACMWRPPISILGLARLLPYLPVRLDSDARYPPSIDLPYVLPPRFFWLLPGCWLSAEGTALDPVPSAFFTLPLSLSNIMLPLEKDTGWRWVMSDGSQSVGRSVRQSFDLSIYLCVCMCICMYGCMHG
jgi:hypothetical protein